MGFGELFLIAVGLSMDAFAVSICKGAFRAAAAMEACAVGRLLFWRLSDADAQFGLSVRHTV